MEFAEKNGMNTLEMTAAGKNLINVTQGMPWADAKPLWEALSTQFASGAGGTVHVFHNLGGISVESIWGTVEYNILKSNGVNMIFHNIK